MDVSMPAKHTTAAQNLLLWPSIKALIPKGITPSYVMEEETGRGLLRLYGCGEGEDKGDGHDGAPSPAQSISSEGRRMDEENTSSPRGVWGSGMLHVPHAHQNQNTREHPGGLSPTGGLMLNSEAVDRYFRSFMENMHIMHPFLELKVVRNMVHAFKRRYSIDYRAKQEAAAIGSKRKRETTDSPISMDDVQRQRRSQTASPMPPIEHSVANAIVLLVLALGKVTAHRDPLPGPASTASMRTSTPHSAMYSDLPMPASADNSPYNNQIHATNGTTTSHTSPQGKNMDIIPGLAYFNVAADILGELPGGADVSHIQAYLLAGLYMGQLARIIPCHFYINKACIAAQILIESTAYVQKTMNLSRRNLINFAFWSCVQLESDIAAELELPLSGIFRHESTQSKELPTNVTLDNLPGQTSESSDILKFYSFQLLLRTTMNTIHAMLYRESKNLETRPSDSIMEVLDTNLEAWRTALANWDWNDNNHEDSNINVARIRGKYYGAKYIIWRPVLRFALSQATQSSRLKRPSDSPRGFGHGSESTSPSISNLNMGHPTGADVPYIRPEILEGAKKCVEAAIRSTTSFDKVARRLVVTNIFGTVHA